MNRTIKFRGLDEDGNWHYGFCSVNNSGEHIIFDTRGPRFAKKVRPETVGEFVGIFDKSRREFKEIYERDIVKYRGENYEVKWCSRTGGFRLHTTFFAKEDRDHEGSLGSSKKFIDNVNYEVVGNIYQNPELLTNN